MNEKVKVEKWKKQSCGVSLWCDKLNKHLQERQEKAEEKFALERKRPRGKEVNQAKYQHFNHNARNTQHCLENTENQAKYQHFDHNNARNF